jgi:DNA-binding transcriptional LysR family regulator
MKFRHLEYFVAAAEELNFTHAADRLHVSQPPFSKQIHDLEGELGIELFDRRRKGVALTPAGKAFLVDARRILEDCDASIKKAQRISRGEIGELAIGYILKVCRRVGFKPRIVKEADGAASALAFVAAGFGVAVVSEPLQKIPAKDVIFRDLAPEESAWVPVGAAWKPNGVSAPVVSQFVDVLAQACANGNGESHAPAIDRLN